jgi:hypothetical protein
MNFLIILTIYAYGQLNDFINLSVSYLLNKGAICFATTQKDINNCFETYKHYKPKHIWYVFMGHSKGKKLNEYLSLSNIHFPQKVDYIILDGCYLGKNKSLIKQLARKYTKYGIFASSNKIPALGMLPLYRDNWKDPYKELKRLKEFYKDNPFAKFFYFQPSF